MMDAYHGIVDPGATGPNSCVVGRHDYRRNSTYRSADGVIVMECTKCGDEYEKDVS